MIRSKGKITRPLGVKRIFKGCKWSGTPGISGACNFNQCTQISSKLCEMRYVFLLPYFTVLGEIDTKVTRISLDERVLSRNREKLIKKVNKNLTRERSLYSVNVLTLWDNLEFLPDVKYRVLLKKKKNFFNNSYFYGSFFF